MTARQRPKAQPLDPSRKRKPRLNSRFTQGALGKLVGRKLEDFAEAGAALALEFGWEGKDDLRLHDIQVSDARRILTKMLFDTHVAAINGGSLPTAESMAEHLCLHTGEFAAGDIEKLRTEISALAASEREAFASVLSS